MVVGQRGKNVALVINKEESKKRGLRTEKKYIEGRKRQRAKMEKKIWGGRWYNKETNPVKSQKSSTWKKMDKPGTVMSEGRAKGIYRKKI